MTTTTTLPTGTWILDQTTTITVTATKLGVMKVPATIAMTSGSIEIDDQHRVTSVSVTGDATSYTSTNAKRNDHVRSADFLDTDAHPTIGFEASSIRPSGSGYTADGTVTVRGNTAPLTVSISDVVVADSAEMAEGAGGSTASFTAAATVDRSTIGVDKLPSFVIGRDLDLVVNATATHQP